MLLVGLALLFRWVLRWSNIPKSDETCFYLLSPIYILLLYPFSIFVLHPLNCPAPLLVLFHPCILILVLLGMIAYRSTSVFIETPWFQRVMSFWGTLSVKEIARILFVFFLGFFILATVKENRIERLDGDEKDYVQIMDSLRRFHTADLSQILKAKKTNLDERMKYLSPHRSVYSVPGTIYSIHHIGLPLLMILPYTLGKKFTGIMFFFNLVMALTIVNLFLLCLEVTKRKTISAVTAVLMGISCPFIFYFRCIYPEVVATLFLVFTFRVLMSQKPSFLKLFVAGCAAAFLPWLHVKFILLSACLAGLAIYRFYRPSKRALVFLMPFIPSALLLMHFLGLAYGSWLPNAQWGKTEFGVSPFFFRGALGQWLDRDHGIFAFAPFYFIVIPGIVSAYRQYRRDVIFILLLVLPSCVVFSSHWMWWGGPCPPGRFLMPLMALLAPFVALGLTYHRHPAYHIPLIFTITITIMLSILSLKYVGELTSHVHFIRSLIPSYDAFPCWPQFFYHRTESVPFINYFVAGMWFMAGLVIWFIWVLMNRRKVEPSTPDFLYCPRISLAALILGVLTFFLLPGICSQVDALGQGRPFRFDSSVRLKLSELNYYLDAFSRPFSRAGVNPSEVIKRFPLITLRASLPVNVKAVVKESDLDKTKLVWVMSGRYTYFYPANYSMDYIMKVIGPEGENVGVIDAAAEKGRVVFAEKGFKGQIHPNFSPINLSFHVSRIYSGAEFRCKAFRPAVVIIERVDVQVQIPS